MGVFAGIFSNLVADHQPPDGVMIDSTHLKTHRTAASLQKGGMFPGVAGARKVG
jgi:putative transposase